MPIFAERTGRANSLANISVKLEQYIPDNSTLVYDAEQKCFILKSSDESYPNITGAINNGAYNSHGVYSKKDGSILEFKEIIAGSGIHITSDEEKLVIRANVTTDRLSVPGSYRITIDNDNNTYEDAKFEIFTARSTTDNPVIISPSSLLPLIVNKLYTGNENGRGYFRSIDDIDFEHYQLKSGMWILVEGTTSQDYFWQIDEIVNSSPINGISNNFYSTIYIKTEFINEYAFNLGGPQYPTIIKQADLCIMEPDPFVNIPFDSGKKYVLQSYSQDFGPNGLDLRPGMIFSLRGTQADLNDTISNDGNYTIYKVKSKTDTELSSITVTANNPFPGRSGPLIEPDPYVPSITIAIREAEVSTGFEVDERGIVKASELISTGMIKMGSLTQNTCQPIENNDLVRKDYVDNMVKPVRGKPKLMFLTNINT
jgi:hypothetical protein